MAQNIDIFILSFLAGMFHLPCLIHIGLSLSCLYPTKNVGLSRDPPRDWVVQQHTYQKRKKAKRVAAINHFEDISFNQKPKSRGQNKITLTLCFHLFALCSKMFVFVFCFFPQIIPQHLDIFINQKVVVLCATTEMS